MGVQKQERQGASGWLPKRPPYQQCIHLIQRCQNPGPLPHSQTTFISSSPLASWVEFYHLWFFSVNRFLLKCKYLTEDHTGNHPPTESHSLRLLILSLLSWEICYIWEIWGILIPDGEKVGRKHRIAGGVFFCIIHSIFCIIILQKSNRISWN